MHMASELDAGDIICQSATPIGENETAPELFQRLAQLGAGLLLEADVYKRQDIWPPRRSA